MTGSGIGVSAGGSGVGFAFAVTVMVASGSVSGCFGVGVGSTTFDGSIYYVPFVSLSSMPKMGACKLSRFVWDEVL